MDRDGDGIDEELNALVRVAITTALQVAEEIARMRQRRAAIEEAEAEQRRADFQRRLDSERAAARSLVEPVMHDQWWKKATPERIGQAYETAAAWERHDPVLSQAADRIRSEVQQRYGVDVDQLAREAINPRPLLETAAAKQIPDLSPDERYVSYLDAQRWIAEANPEQAERLGLQVLEATTEDESLAAQNAAIEAYRQLVNDREAAATGGKTTEQVAEGAAQLAAADSIARAAAERERALHARVDKIMLDATITRTIQVIDEEVASYDSAKRRDQLATALAEIHDPESVEARMLEDVSNALPASAAVKQGRHPKARKTRGVAAPSQEIEYGS